jgi:hypothetical protein
MTQKIIKLITIGAISSTIMGASGWRIPEQSAISSKI